MPEHKPDKADKPNECASIGSSPILRIPPEVLSEIFNRCLPEDGLPRPHPFEAPLLLCQICSYFRTVALSSPKLWAGISINRSAERDGDALTLDMWIKRSGSHPLSFSLAYRETGSNIDKLIDSLAPHSSRWKDITVGFADDLVLPNFIHAISRGPSALENLTIKSTETSKFVGFLAGRSTGTLTILNVSLAHNLVEITVAVHMNFQLDFGSAMLNNVRKITFVVHSYIWVYASRIFHCLEHCPAVEKLACDGRMIDVSGLESVNPLTLPFLEQFYITGGYWNPHAFFDRFHLPGLRTLSYGCKHSGLSPITRLLKRSCALIEDLYITTGETFASENDSIDCLEHAPRLKTFMCNFWSDLLSRILTLTPTRQLCVGLESITLFAVMKIDFSVLGEMIFSRWCIPLSDESCEMGLRGGRRLKKVIIHDGVQRKHLLEIPAIALCVAEGLELECDQ